MKEGAMKEGAMKERIMKEGTMTLRKEEMWIKQLVCEIIGCIFIAAGLYNFAVQARFPMSGFSGIAILLNRLAGLPVGLGIFLLNIPVSLLCYRLLGRRFFIRSMRCMALSSLLMDYVAPLFPAYTGERILAALCTGVFMGIGYAIIYMQGSSTAGMDFLIMAVKKKKPHLPISRILFLADFLVVTMGGLVLRDIDGIIYGIIVSFLLSTVVDKFMYGVNAGKMALVVTDHGQKICDAIDLACQRGSTILEATGGYRGDHRQIVLCVCSNKEMYRIQRTVKETDPQAFTIVLESNEVMGEGFRNIQVG